MDLSEQVKEFRVLQKTHRIRVAYFCRERTLDYYEMVESLKKDKYLPELPKEEIEMSKVDITDNALTNKDGEILRLLNQIALEMVKRSDVDEIVKGAVAEEHDRMVAYYEEKMKAMAAEYEAVIASLKKKDKGGKKCVNSPDSPASALEQYRNAEGELGLAAVHGSVSP